MHYTRDLALPVQEKSDLEDGLCFLDVRQDPFTVYGLYNYRQEAAFKRLPDELAKNGNEGVARLYLNTAGGRARFSTTSSLVAIRARMTAVTHFPHMALTGSAGFDLYLGQKQKSSYQASFIPPIDMADGYEALVQFPDSRLRQLTINFPLYSDVTDLHIGLAKDSQVGPGLAYRYANPVLYYGSSITQGGCASRPGNSYQAIISRMLDCDHINLGFSGSGRAEDILVSYMAGLEKSVFVSDYDHNAPDADHLARTHQKMFQAMREKSANLPIILVSRPDFERDEKESIVRREIIYQTYQAALSKGDANVYFVDGQYLFKDANRDCCTVDAVHPNDAGFLRMAEVIGHFVEKALLSR